jgi:hypothetical protein
MPRYVVEQESGDAGPAERQGPFEGLAVAKAVARKTADESQRPTIVRDADSGAQLARFEPSIKPDPAEDHEPASSLAYSVKRMRAANDELKKALIPLAERVKKG